MNNQFENHIVGIRMSRAKLKSLQEKIKLYEDTMLQEEWYKLEEDIIEACSRLQMSYESKDLTCTYNDNTCKCTFVKGNFSINKDTISIIREDFIAALEFNANLLKGEINTLTDKLDDYRRSTSDC